MPTKQTASSDEGLPTNIGQPATRALAGIGITKLRQLTRTTEADISKLHGVGPSAIKRLHEALARAGISFAKPDRR
jgi:predicted flap endonuclease-1-like 5' DNA nuclease